MEQEGKMKKSVRAWAVVYSPETGVDYVYLEHWGDTGAKAIAKFVLDADRTWKQFYREGFRVRRVEISWEEKA